jgi:uncharacterized membrane protein
MKKIIYSALILLAIEACKTTDKAVKTETAKSEIVCPKILLTYNQNIKSIIDDNCVSCHSGKSPAHGIDLASYEKVKFATTKPHFMGSINHEKGFDKMPAGQAKLDDALIKKISCWITNGAPQ